MKKNLFKTGLVCFLLMFVLVVLSCDGDFDDQLKITVTNINSTYNGKLAYLELSATTGSTSFAESGINIVDVITNGSVTFTMNEFDDNNKPYMKGASHAGMNYRVTIFIYENQTPLGSDIFAGAINSKYIDVPDISINFNEFSALPALP